MNNSNRPSLFAPAAGVVAGVAVFLGVNITTGRAVIPTAESVTNLSHGLTAPNHDVSYLPKEATTADGAAGGGPYQRVCQACHQADGNGLPGAFPPLAGSEWVIGDAETPIRIVLLGLGGEIEVKGAKFNALMPPPPAMTDEEIAEAVTHARTSFGNKASAVDAALVKQVRESLSGRTQTWTADELIALRGTAAPAVPEGAGDAGVAPAEAAPAEAPAQNAPEPGETATPTPAGQAPAPTP
jgi:mono/diheme cytochrome c family protein